MADIAPITFKRKGARPTQRSRPTETEDVASPHDASEAAVISNIPGSGEESPSVLAAKLKTKLKSRTQPKSKLSFGVDEDVRCPARFLSEFVT